MLADVLLVIEELFADVLLVIEELLADMDRLFDDALFADILLVDESVIDELFADELLLLSLVFAVWLDVSLLEFVAFIWGCEVPFTIAGF